MGSVTNCILILGNVLAVMKTQFLNTVQRNTAIWPEHPEGLGGVRGAQVGKFVGVPAPESRSSWYGAL